MRLVCGLTKAYSKYMLRHDLGTVSSRFTGTLMQCNVLYYNTPPQHEHIPNLALNLVNLIGGKGFMKISATSSLVGHQIRLTVPAVISSRI
jgi:hypothetical protein